MSLLLRRQRSGNLPRALILAWVLAAGSDQVFNTAAAQEDQKSTTDALAAASKARAEAPDVSSNGRQPRLGELTFPTSGSDAAQPMFVTAVKLLHNFEYDEARALFRKCQEVDPSFAMAYWGEAMCCNHALHLEQDVVAGRAILKRLAEVKGVMTTEREDGFLLSVKALFGKGSKQERDRRYLKRLAELSNRFPDDHEVSCFYALAMLGASAGNRDTRVYVRAAAILEEVYLHNAMHPGVLHYLIHCYDDPVHAPLGLRAARTYGTIAENSAHAKHMPSHIYLPLGMWDEVITANESAWQAGVQRLKRLKLGEADHDIHALHALQWLHYGYLQKGNYGRALELLKTMAGIHRRKPTTMCKWYFALMRGAYVVDAPDWRKAGMDIEMDGVELSATAGDLFANGLAAIRGKTTGAERAQKRIEVLRVGAERDIEDTSRHHSSYFDGVFASSIRAARIMETQLEALILFADGHKDQAVQRMKDAAAAEERMAFGYGPPLPQKPSHELLGEMLLNLNRPQEARRYFDECLRRTPRRTASLVGLREAARATEDTETLETANKELGLILHDPQSAYRAWRDLPFARDFIK